ncbi:MAG: hypothetical protein WCS70_10125, partial [Verrucomicrobiota bacterium]
MKTKKPKRPAGARFVQREKPRRSSNVRPPPFAISWKETPEPVILDTWYGGARPYVNVKAISDALEQIFVRAEAEAAEMRAWRETHHPINDPRHWSNTPKWLHHEVFHIVHNAVFRLTELVQKNPEVWRVVSSRHKVWPVLLSAHPMRKQRVKALLEILSIGSDTDIPRVHSKARWNTDHNPFTLVAHQLYDYVGLSRFMAYSAFTRGRPEGWQAKASQLDPLSPTTWPEWWAVAREIFLESYPHPEEIKQLAN